MLNKVPEVTLYFWVIKVLCTTVGETASDYLTDNVGLGLTMTTFITGALLLAVARRPVPRCAATCRASTGSAVVLISVVGTQITDNLTDNSRRRARDDDDRLRVALAVDVRSSGTLSERTLSIHTIFTTRREAFYWLAVLFTFALGTAAGDLTRRAAEPRLLRWPSLHLRGAIARRRRRALPVRPQRGRRLLGRLHPHPPARRVDRRLPLAAARDGGLGLGTTVTSFIFLATILVVVAFLTLTRRDVTEAAELGDPPITRILVVLHGSSAVNGILDAVRGRHARGPAQFHLLVSDSQANEILASTLRLLPEIDIEGSVSTRENPMDAVEESLHDGRFDEVIVDDG